MTSHSSYWSQFSATYDEIVGEEGDQSQRLIINPIVQSLLGDLSNHIVLDAGCGNGYWTRRLATQAKSVVGVDFTSSLIERAKQKGIPANASFTVGNLERLEFSDNTFNTVLLSMVLIDIENLEKIVREVARVTKLDGVVVISILHPCFENPPNTYSLKNESGQKIGRAVSNYFVTGLIENKEQKYQHFHRTLSDYFNTFADNGLHLEKMVEPNGSELLGLKEDDHHPYFMILKLRKAE